MTYFKHVLFASAVMAVATTAAMADTVNVPVGDWAATSLAGLRDIVIALAVGGLGLLARRLPAQLGTLLTAMLTEQVLTRAVDYALGAVSDVVKGKVLTVSAANAVIAAAEAYAVKNAPDLVAKLGATLRPKILARLSAAGVVPAEATAAQLGASLRSVP